MLNSVTDKQLNVYCTVEANGSVNSIVKPEETVYLPPLPLSKEGENLLTKADADKLYLLIPEEYKFGHTGGYNDFFICNQSGKMESVRIAFCTHGLNINQGYLGIVPPSNNTIKAQSAAYNPITPSTLSYATVIGLTENKLALTDEQKYLATTWLGAVKHADTPTGYSAVYAIDRQGNDITVSYSPQISSWTLAQRGNGGTLIVGAPTEDSHATPKSYVDNLPDKITDEAIKAKWVAWLGMSAYYTKAETDANLAEIERDIKVLGNALMQGGITYKPTTEDTYNERITAEGVNVVDGSEAVLQKVVGSTVRCENLLPYPYVEKSTTKNGITFTVNDDGSITINGTATSSALFVLSRNLELKTETQYTINGGKDGITVLARTNPNDASWIESGNGKFETGTLLEGNTINYIGMYVVGGVTVNNVTIYPMFNEGSTAKPYQPYFTGLKSASFAGIESGGRNLFNEKFYNGAWSASTGERFSSPQYVCNAKKIPVVGDTKYYLSYKKTGTEYIQFVLYYNKNGSLLSTSRDSFIITTPADCAFICFNILIKDTSGNSFIGDSIGTVMLNYGSTALPYTPYIEPTVFDFPKTPTPMGTTIDFENKKIIEGSREIVLDGTENWILADTEETYSGNGNRYRFGITLLNDISLNNQLLVNSVSSHYISVSAIDTWGNKQGLSIATDNLYIYDEAYATKTVAEWKAHLAELYASGNPVIFRYLLATPTETPFTEEQKAVGNEYRVWANGTESVRENDGKEYGADNTLTQDYIAIKE